MRWKRWIAAFAVTAALVAVSPVGEAAAKKSKVVGKVNGRRFKAAKKSIVAFINSFSVSVGGAVVPHRPRATVRAIGLLCLVDNLAAQALPMTLACAADYYELKLGSAAPRKQWDTATGIQVTLEHFDGTRLRGTFQGTLEIVDPTHPEDPPATVENGKFDVILMNL
jgi:hypothetical protein